MTVELANEPTKMEEADLLEGARTDLLQALEGVGMGAKQLAGQVIGQAVVEKTDEPDPPVLVGPTRSSGVVTRATRSLKDILAERRRREQEEEELEEEDLPEERGVAQQALDKYERDMEAAQLSRKRRQEEVEEEQEAKKLKRSERHHR